MNLLVEVEKFLSSLGLETHLRSVLLLLGQDWILIGALLKVRLVNCLSLHKVILLFSKRLLV